MIRMEHFHKRATKQIVTNLDSTGLSRGYSPVEKAWHQSEQEERGEEIHNDQVHYQEQRGLAMVITSNIQDNATLFVFK